jgi:predicted Rossmann fold flavoprotein
VTPPVVVIGAGAAGLVAAIFAASAGGRVLLIERTRDGGRKILISGGGRCNILPASIDAARFVTASSVHSLRNMLRSWPLVDQRRFFEREAGIDLVLEPETGKLFPASNDARQVRDALVALARRRGAVLRFESRVVDVAPPAGRGGAWSVRLAEGASIEASAVVLATGGLSVPTTGSDGGGLEIARRLGHTINATYPALTPLVASPHPHAGLAGVSLNAALDAPPIGHARRHTRTRGGFLFTHRGYSGPAVLDMSHVAVLATMAGASQPILASWASLDPDEWGRRLGARDRTVISVLRGVLPVRLAAALLDEAGLDRVRRAGELRRAERRLLVERLTRYRLPWTGHEGYRKAEVTGGGVRLSDVNPGTLESRIRPGLFVCGEMLDAFGPIGGHNFAWAWATGRAAGLGAGRPPAREGPDGAC